MVRAFMTLLLLAVFFLSGMLFGMDHGQRSEQVIPEERQENQLETNVDTGHNEEVIEVADNSEADTDADSSQFTQKSAAFLGNIIQGFYEMVVTIFYQFAQLFF